MFLRPHRSRWVDGSTSFIRQFSIARQCPKGPDGPNQPGSTAPSSRAQPKRTNIPPAKLNSKNVNSDRPRPRRIIDARSLGARQNDGQSNILRSSGFRNAQNPSQARARRPRTPAKGKSAPPKARKSVRSRASRYSDMEEGDDIHKAEIESVFHELTEKTKPSPSQYQPRPPSLQNLAETWPSLPTNSTAYSAGVIEKLSMLSDRSPNGYAPPNELGRRLFEGKYVRFLNDEEKTQALSIAKSLSRERADKISQRKGELVEPKTINFEPLDTDNRKSLLESLVQGKYHLPEASHTGQHPVLGEILRNLRNNETYQVPKKSSEFIAKIESLLSSSRPAKRV